MKQQNPIDKAKPILSVDAFGPLLDELARRVAKVVLAELEDKLFRPRLLNGKQAAWYLGIEGSDPAQVLRQRKGEKHFSDTCWIKMGRSTMWDVDALDKWIDSKKSRVPRAKSAPNGPMKKR